ncbi:MAG TPA: hypothetical protein VF541_17440 [Longimicrobium sp.]
MYPDQQPWRELYDAMMEYGGGALYADVLRPWLARQDGERRWLDELRARKGDPVPAVSMEESCRLYALSRIVDLLNLSFAPWGREREDTWKTETVGADEMAAFMEALGMEPVARERFHPFHHEIVSVDQSADASVAPELVREHWRGWRLGPLLISRAGCEVRAGTEHVVKEIAETSTLYWAFARHTRPTQDLSVGWGSNSQWRTRFRRDYELGGTLYFNVDGRGRDPKMDTDLSEAERLELLRHRCFVRCGKPHGDRFPYNETWVESA